jgi:hypothetical protein
LHVLQDDDALLLIFVWRIPAVAFYFTKKFTVDHHFIAARFNDEREEKNLP